MFQQDQRLYPGNSSSIIYLQLTDGHSILNTLYNKINTAYYFSYLNEDKSISLHLNDFLSNTLTIPLKIAFRLTIKALLSLQFVLTMMFSLTSMTIHPFSLRYSQCKDNL